MARIGTRRGNEDLLPIDSLMDILTGTVGIMIIVAVFAVLEVVGISFTLFKPIGMEPKEEMQVERVLLQDGKIRFMGIRRAVTNYVAQEKLGTGDNYDTDNTWFKYVFKIEYKEHTIRNSFRFRLPELHIVISERAGAKGEDIKDIEDPKSRFRTMLAQLDSEKSWILFMVDGKSIELFRKARQICHTAGFVSGWNPSDKFTFPHTFVLSGAGSGASPVTDKVQSP